MASVGASVLLPWALVVSVIMLPECRRTARRRVADLLATRTGAIGANRDRTSEIASRTQIAAIRRQ